MHVFPSAIKGQLDRQFGSEPLVIAEVEFVPGYAVAFCDRKLNGEDTPLPKIIEVGNLDNSALVALSSDSQSVSLTLDDTDGTLKELIDNNDISLGKVRFSLGFQGVPFSERAFLMEGVINSPIEYNPLSKSLTLTVISRISDAESGFSMDDGDFPNVPADQRGQQWPLAFGTVCNMETLPLKPLFKGVLGEPLGAIDPTIELRLCQAQKLQCPSIISPEFQQKIDQLTRARDKALEDFRSKYNEARKGLIYVDVSPSHPQAGRICRYCNSTDEALALFLCQRRSTDPRRNPALSPLESIPGCIPEGEAERKLVDDFQKQIDEVADEARKVFQECVDARHSQVCKIITERTQQTPYVKSSVQIIGGDQFPQNTPISIRIRDVKYNGTMVGETFFISGVTHPDSLRINNPPCTDIESSFQFQATVSSDTLPTTVAGCQERPEIQELIVGPGASWRYFQDLEAGNFIWLPSGTDVFLEASSKVTHIVSLVPGIVTQVCAYRTFGDTKLLVEVDPSEYVVKLTNYGDYQVTELEFDRDLTDIPDENWDSEVYVTFQSNFGPNPVNVIQYLVDTYTNYTVDAASFAAVHAALAKYPANFVIRERKTVFELIKEIAYQFRCAVTLRGGIVYLKYLSIEPTSVKDLTDDDILRETFALSTTATEDIATKHVITWSETEAHVYPALNKQDSFVLKHNIGKYGTSEVTHNYFTQNTFSTIEKSATFWMIRDANSWRYVEFETTIKHLDLDVYDCITVTMPEFPTTKCIIESMSVDFDNHTIKFKCWTPILAGTTTQYKWAWPAGLPAGSVFPDPDYTDRGDGLKKNVRPPVGHPLRQGFNAETVRLATDGDKNPSDLDDVYPANTCLSNQATDSAFSTDIEPIFRPFEAQAFSNFASDLDSRAPTPSGFPLQGQGGSSGGAGGGGDGSPDGGRKKRKPNGDCVVPNFSGCIFTVTVTFVLPDLLRPGCDVGPCTSDATSGFACSGTIDQVCFQFDNEGAAESFRAQKQAEAAAKACAQKRGSFGVYSVSPVAQSKLSCPTPKKPNSGPVGFHSGNPDLQNQVSNS